MIEVACDVDGCESRAPAVIGGYGSGLPDGWATLSGSRARESPVGAVSTMLGDVADDPDLPAGMQRYAQAFGAVLPSLLPSLTPPPEVVTLHLCPKHDLPPMRIRR